MTASTINLPQHLIQNHIGGAPVGCFWSLAAWNSCGLVAKHQLCIFGSEHDDLKCVKDARNLEVIGGERIPKERSWLHLQRGTGTTRGEFTRYPNSWLLGPLPVTVVTCCRACCAKLLMWRVKHWWKRFRRGFRNMVVGQYQPGILRGLCPTMVV